MPLNSKMLDKIRYLYEIANQITKYWIHIESYKFDEYKKAIDTFYNKVLEKNG